MILQVDGLIHRLYIAFRLVPGSFRNVSIADSGLQNLRHCISLTCTAFDHRGILIVSKLVGHETLIYRVPYEGPRS